MFLAFFVTGFARAVEPGRYRRGQFARMSAAALRSRAALVRMRAETEKRADLLAQKDRVSREFQREADQTIPALLRQFRDRGMLDPVTEGLVYARLEQHRRARKRLLAAIGEAPDDPRVRSGDVVFDLAAVIAREGTDDVASELLTEQSARYRGEATFARRVEIWERQRRLGVALRKSLERAIRVDPTDAEAIWGLARFYRHHPVFRDEREERIRLTQLLAVFKRSPHVTGGLVRWRLAQNYERCFQYREALLRYRDVKNHHFKVQGVPDYDARLQEALERLKAFE